MDVTPTHGTTPGFNFIPIIPPPIYRSQSPSVICFRAPVCAPHRESVIAILRKYRVATSAFPSCLSDFEPLFPCRNAALCRRQAPPCRDHNADSRRRRQRLRRRGATSVSGAPGDTCDSLVKPEPRTMLIKGPGADGGGRHEAPTVVDTIRLVLCHRRTGGDRR